MFADSLSLFKYIYLRRLEVDGLHLPRKVVDELHCYVRANQCGCRELLLSLQEGLYLRLFGATCWPNGRQQRQHHGRWKQMKKETATAAVSYISYYGSCKQFMMMTITRANGLHAMYQKESIVGILSSGAVNFWFLIWPPYCFVVICRWFPPTKPLLPIHMIKQYDNKFFPARRWWVLRFYEIVLSQSMKWDSLYVHSGNHCAFVLYASLFGIQFYTFGRSQRFFERPHTEQALNVFAI